MGKIKIEDLPKEQKITKKEMRAITGAGVEPSPFSGPIGSNYGTVRIFRKPPVFMEKNDAEESIFNTMQIKY
jgi:hypothetical protein